MHLMRRGSLDYGTGNVAPRAARLAWEKGPALNVIRALPLVRALWKN